MGDDSGSVSGKVNAVIAAMLDVEDGDVLPGARLREDLGANEEDVWTLMLALEDELGVSMGDDDACEEWITVADVVDYCESALQANRA